MSEKGFFSRKALLARAKKWAADAATHRANGNIAQAEIWEAAVADCHKIIEDNRKQRAKSDYRGTLEHMAMMRSKRGGPSR